MFGLEPEPLSIEISDLLEAGISHSLDCVDEQLESALAQNPETLGDY